MAAIILRQDSKRKATRAIMNDCYIVYAKRTPIGRIGGMLKDLRVDDMLACVFSDLLKSCPIDPLLIDDIITGCANQAGEDNRNLSRMSSLLANIPMDVPATTINRLCGSSLDAASMAFSKIASGQADCIVVGGAESMTRGPLVVSKPSMAYGRDSKMYDSTFGWRFPNSQMKKLFPLYSMGETAEVLVEKFQITRENQDQFALKSHQKATYAIHNGHFKDEVLPLTFKSGKKMITCDTDEGPRKDSSIEKLQKLRAVFKDGGSVTAGNSSSMNDGAAALLLVSESFLKKHNLTPLLKITATAVRGLHPNEMGLGPSVASKLLCKRAGMDLKDFDIIELNEAFAAQSLACLKDMDISEEIVNFNGGAIALGHPLGCSGARILTTLAHIMTKNKRLKKGLATMCIGVGQGIALSVENCN
jgi:acetyl-CoA acyltransferase